MHTSLINLLIAIIIIFSTREWFTLFSVVLVAKFAETMDIEVSFLRTFSHGKRSRPVVVGEEFLLNGGVVSSR